jgi:hypothetical protein
MSIVVNTGLLRGGVALNGGTDRFDGNGGVQDDV